MEHPREALQSALATLQTRWGSAAVRLGDGRLADASVVARGASAVARGPAIPAIPGPPGAAPMAPAAGVISTGFPALDAILGPGGLPAEASLVIRGGPSSGKTTLALRAIAEAQAAGDVVAYLDLARSFDPVEAVGRGVDLRWLLVIRPADLSEGLGLAASLLSGRSIGLLVVDVPARSRAPLEERFGRLMAHARRVGARLIVLEPRSVDATWQAALAGGTGIRLELERLAWLRLGRDVIGQRTTAVVARNRYGPPGRSVELDIQYLMDGERSVATHQLASEDTVWTDATERPGWSTPRLVVA